MSLFYFFFFFFLTGGTTKISHLLVVTFSHEIHRSLNCIKSSASLFNIFKISKQILKLLWRIPKQADKQYGAAVFYV